MIVFDTRESNTADPDLEGPFLIGNLSGQGLGNLLVFASDLDTTTNGIVGAPNDAMTGGMLRIDFNEQTVDSFGFALVDAPESLSGETFDITFFSSGTTQATFTFAEYLVVTQTTDFVAADKSANQFASVSAQALGLSNIQSVEINLLASGGIDNITWTEGGAVPEPSTALLSLIGLGFIARRRR